MAALLPAQGGMNRSDPPAGGGNTLLLPGREPKPQDEDSGPRPGFFAIDNVDRFVRKAKDFLARDEYDAAIQVLVDVLEGKVVQDAAPPQQAPSQEVPQPEPANRGRQPGRAPTQPPERPTLPSPEDDPSRAVYSADGRLFRPVRRLVHELLAGLPPAGIELFRARYEVEAEQAYRTAMARRDPRALEAVATRWFVTKAAARALLGAGDLLMDQGELRAAMQLFLVLRDVYPKDERRAVLGPDASLWVRIALCLQLLGERQRAVETLHAAAAEQPDAAVRVLGEAVALRDLERHPLFAGGPGGAPGARAASFALGGESQALVPLWELRFADPQPYRAAQAEGQRANMVTTLSGEGSNLPAPRPREFAPGGTVAILGDEVAFFDHMRLRVHEAGSGRAVLETQHSLAQQRPRQGAPRARHASFDYAVQQVEWDEQRFYFVFGSDRPVGNRRLELCNELIAIDARSGNLVWTTRTNRERGTGTSELTWLAAPTRHGTLLLAPVLDQGAYGVQCVEAATGRPVYRTLLHIGGSELVRAPGVRVVVQGGTAFVATNAGALGALDAATGELRWLRRVEREDPFRPPVRRLRSRAEQNVFGMVNYYREHEQGGFAPAELLVRDGIVLCAPTDGQCLLGVDGASGELLWVVPREGNAHRHLLGANRKHVYLAGSRLLCVDLRSGVRLWEDEVPMSAPLRFAGRGLVNDEWVVLPDDRALLMLPADGGRWRRLALPRVAPGEGDQTGPVNLTASGPYVAAVYEGGVELYGVPEAIASRAQSETDPRRRANWLLLAGDLHGALAVAEAELAKLNGAGEPEPPERDAWAQRAIDQAGEIALESARAAAREPALAVLDRVRPLLRGSEELRRWRLHRVNVLRVLKDGAAAEREQRLLEEGRE